MCSPVLTEMLLETENYLIENQLFLIANWKYLKTTATDQCMLGFNIIEEYGRKQKHLFQENITLFLWEFWWEQ